MNFVDYKSNIINTILNPFSSCAFLKSAHVPLGHIATVLTIMQFLPVVFTLLEDVGEGKRNLTHK